MTTTTTRDELIDQAAKALARHPVDAPWPYWTPEYIRETWRVRARTIASTGVLGKGGHGVFDALSQLTEAALATLVEDGDGIRA